MQADIVLTDDKELGLPPIDSTIPTEPPVVITTPSIIGYQYGDRSEYTGTYEFPNNLDKEHIHIPPRTVLDAPPTTIPDGQEAIWSGTEWTLADKPKPAENPYYVAPEIIPPPTAEEIAAVAAAAAAAAAARAAASTTTTTP